MWADHRVRACDTAEYELRHPLVGSLTVRQQTLTVPSEPEQSLVMVTATPGSASRAALRLLAQAIGAGSGTTAVAGTETMAEAEAGVRPSRRDAATADFSAPGGSGRQRR